MVQKFKTAESDREKVKTVATTEADIQRERERGKPLVKRQSGDEAKMVFIFLLKLFFPLTIKFGRRVHTTGTTMNWILLRIGCCWRSNHIFVHVFCTHTRASSLSLLLSLLRSLWLTLPGECKNKCLTVSKFLFKNSYIKNILVFQPHFHIVCRRMNLCLCKWNENKWRWMCDMARDWASEREREMAKLHRNFSCSASK